MSSHSSPASTVTNEERNQPTPLSTTYAVATYLTALYDSINFDAHKRAERAIIFTYERKVSEHARNATACREAEWYKIERRIRFDRAAADEEIATQRNIGVLALVQDTCVVVLDELYGVNSAIKGCFKHLKIIVGRMLDPPLESESDSDEE